MSRTPEPSHTPEPSITPASAQADRLDAANALAAEAERFIANSEFPTACYLLVGAITQSDNIHRRRELAKKMIDLLLKTLW